MIEPIKNALTHAGAGWVLWLLAGLSLLSLTVMIDRARVFWAQRDDVSDLVRDLHRLLGKGNLDATRGRLARSPSSAAAIALSGLAQWEKGASAVREAMAA